MLIEFVLVNVLKQSLEHCNLKLDVGKLTKVFIEIYIKGVAKFVMKV